jgi:D-beta-D-heptose 7-phosphate kinase/D-beta-D-heptose 1-phosphate adenosyltransferase
MPRPAPRIIVLGDLILDRYLHGTVDRISPEAPVPVVRLAQTEIRAGGAANVALNLVSLGSQVVLGSVVGDDAAANSLLTLLQRVGIDIQNVIRQAGRPTTVKTRVMARHQQVVRLDEEDDSPVSDASAQRLVECVRQQLESADGLLVSDYAKGVLDSRVLAPLLAAARAANKLVVIDPKRSNFSLYAPAHVITPNQTELARAAQLEIRQLDDVERAARQLLDSYRFDAVLVTRGEAGMMLVARDRPVLSVPAQAREVYDVTGAGDTVVATLAARLAAGDDLAQAAEWSNYAAAIAVGRLGTAAVSWDEIVELRARLGPSGGR